MHPSPTDRRYVTVGVEETAAAVSAARYAALKAAQNGLPLLAVHAYRPSLTSDPMRVLEESRAAERVVEGVLEQLTLAPGVRFERQVAATSPRRLLAGLEEVSALLVLGHQGPLRGRRAPGRGLASSLVSRARCPVAIVPPTWFAQHDGRPVVVALDGEAPATELLRHVFEQASLTSAPVVVAHAVRRGTRATEAAAHRAGIEIMLAGWKADHPDVDVRVVSEIGEPASLIIEMSGQASEMVVGASRGLLRSSRWYWSVVRGVLEASACPLVVVPAEQAVDHQPQVHRSTGRR